MHNEEKGGKKHIDLTEKILELYREDMKKTVEVRYDE